MISLAESLRRSSTYCEISHLNASCTSISPRDGTVAALEAAQLEVASTSSTSSTPLGALEDCPLFVPAAGVVANGSVSLPAGAQGNRKASRWNAPFFLPQQQAARSGAGCSALCVQRFKEYLSVNGCCSTMEEEALIEWWKAVGHPSSKSFQLTWLDGHTEVFHEPLFSCEGRSAVSGGADGEKLLSRCVMNDLCGQSARNFFEAENFPTSCCTGELAPTCCSMHSPLTGNLSVCDHGEQHRPGDCWCACELGWVGRTCDRTDIHMVFDIIIDR